jgi:hypothetical protein
LHFGEQHDDMTRRNNMVAKAVAVLGMVALACAATGTRSFASQDSSGKGGGLASPMPIEAPACSGWYDAVARVCDSVGD